MSLGPRPSYLPAVAHSILGQKLAGGLQAPRPNRISLKDDRFTLITESGQVHPRVAPALALQVLIVGSNSHASRVFYDSDSYDPDNPDAPVCWSDNGIGPSDKSSQPQSPTCAQCPKAVWGSAISKMSGKGVPACSGRKKIAVLVAGATEDGPFLLDIPGGSIKPFSLYLAHIGNVLHASPEEVVTEVTMVNKELAFRDAAWLPADMLPGVKAMVDSEAPDMVVNEHDRPVQARLAAPSNQWGDTIKLTNKPTPEQAAQWNSPPPSTEMQPDPFARMYPQGPIAEQYRPTHPTMAEQAQQMDERNPPLTGRYEDLTRHVAPQQQFAPPMTSQQAEAVNSGQPAPATRKPRSDKGVSRKQETVVGPGPIPPQTFAPPQPNGGFIQGASPIQQATTNSTPQFGMVAEPQAPTAALDNMLAKAFGGLKFGQ